MLPTNIPDRGKSLRLRVRASRSRDFVETTAVLDHAKFAQP